MAIALVCLGTAAFSDRWIARRALDWAKSERESRAYASTPTAAGDNSSAGA